MSKIPEMISNNSLKRFVSVVSLVFIFVLSASAEYRGNVYADLNKNRQKDANEKGVQGVVVTDGLNVVLTDGDGNFSLPGTEKTRFIYITVPSGYRTTGRFYLPAGDESSGYDFGLCASPLPEKKKVRFIQLADTEATYDFGWTAPIRDYAVGEGISFIIHTGDICYENGLNFHGSNVTTETMGVPVFYCIGNHDLVKGSYGEELFEKNFGPVFYSFDAGNTHFVVTPMLYGDQKPSYTKDDVYHWLKNDLQQVDPSKNLVVFNHNLLTLDDEFLYGINDTETINLNEHNLKAWIYGHWHSNYLIRHGSTGIISVCTAPPNKGGIDHSVSNFPVYEISDKGDIKVDQRFNYLRNHLAVITPAGEQCVVDQMNNLLVSVNTYSAISPTEKTEFRIGGTKKWVPLVQNSNWNWSGKVSAAELQRGVPHTITIRVTLRNGDTFSGVRSFVLEDMATAKEQQGEGLKTKPELRWIVNAGTSPGICPPLCAGTQIFVAATDDFGERNYIISYDRFTGEMLWRYKTDGPVKNSISIEDDRILASDEGGIAYALDKKSGELLWKRDLEVRNLPLPVTGGVVKEGVYYCGFGNYLSALSTSDGSMIWRNSAWNGGEGTTSTMIVCGNTLIAGCNWRALYGHDINTGEKKWEQRDDGIRFCNGTASWTDDTLFFAAERAIVKMDPESGKIFSVHPVPYALLTASTTLVTEKMIVTTTLADGVVAYDRYSFKELWKVTPSNALVYTAPYSKPNAATVESSPLPAGDRIIFGASDGYLYIVDSNNGRILNKTDLGAPILGNICLRDGLLYVTDLSGNLCCFAMSEDNN